MTAANSYTEQSIADSRLKLIIQLRGLGVSLSPPAPHKKLREHKFEVFHEALNLDGFCLTMKTSRPTWFF